MKDIFSALEANNSLEIYRSWTQYIPAGWQNAFVQAVRKIEKTQSEKFRICNITYPRGHLNVQFASEISKFTSICHVFDDLGNWSGSHCCICGSSANLKDNVSKLPYCHDCANRRLEKMKANHKYNYTLEQVFQDLF